LHAARHRRETAEHPFGTLKMRMGAMHFLTKRLPKVATEMALHVLAHNLIRGDEHHGASNRRWPRSEHSQSRKKQLASILAFTAKRFNTAKTQNGH